MWVLNRFSIQSPSWFWIKTEYKKIYMFIHFIWMGWIRGAGKRTGHKIRKTGWRGRPPLPPNECKCHSMDGISFFFFLSSRSPLLFFPIQRNGPNVCGSCLHEHRVNIVPFSVPWLGNRPENTTGILVAGDRSACLTLKSCWKFVSMDNKFCV